jgi:hypothetical protein
MEKTADRNGVEGTVSKQYRGQDMGGGGQGKGIELIRKKNMKA